MNSIYGYLYVRCSKIYDSYDACKLGIASNIPDRDSVYATGEIERGYFELVFEVLKKEMRIIENLLKYEFVKFNIIKYDGGTEFYNKEIINFIEPTIKKYGITYKILTNEEINNLERCNRAIKIISNAFKNINIKNFIQKLKLNQQNKKYNQLNKYIEQIKEKNIIKDKKFDKFFHIPPIYCIYCITSGIRLKN